MRMKRRLSIWILSSVIFVLFWQQSVTAEAASNTSFNDVSEKHWARGAIEWGYTNGIVKGDKNNNFLPEAKVTEAEFLAMVVRAYEDEYKVRATQTGEKWYIPYFDLAADEQWYIYGYNPTSQRYHVANLVYSMLQGQFVSNEHSIQYLLDTGLSTGKTSATVEGYLPYEQLTRAEAIAFIQRIKKTYPSINKTSQLKISKGLREIQLGDTEAKVIEALGQPARKDSSPHSYTWYVYNKSNDKFAMIGISKENKVVALYSNARNVWGEDQPLTVGSSQSELKSVIKDAKTNLYGYVQKKSNGITTNYYIDNQAEGMIDAIFMFASDLIGVSNSKQAEIDAGFDRQIFDLTNVFRHKNALRGSLVWNDMAAKSAYNHSKDMYTNKYMDHKNLQGQTSQDRMYAAGLRNFGGGENIAYGYESGFDVYVGWVNSVGHRENMLFEHYKMLGVGSYQKYYTQNFVMPY